jgi:hypothetical protein
MVMVREETGGPDAPVARRLQLLRQCFTGDNGAEFARRYARITPNRWNNFERGYPLSKDVAFNLVRWIPGLSLDWLWHGERRGLTFDLVARLDEMEATLERNRRPS